MVAPTIVSCIWNGRTECSPTVIHRYCAINWDLTVCYNFDNVGRGLAPAALNITYFPKRREQAPALRYKKHNTPTNPNLSRNICELP